MLLFVLMNQLLIIYAKIIVLLLKAVLVFVAIHVIYSKIFELNNTVSFKFIDNFSSFQLALIFIVMSILTTVNWMLEFVKWKVLVTAITKISLADAAKQCLTAHTAAIITPYKMGEFGAKTLFFESQKVAEVLFLNLLGNASQLMATVFFGLIGLFFYQQFLETIFTTLYRVNYFLLLVFFLSAVLLFITILLRKKNTFWQPISSSIHQKNIGIALLRYLIFSHQWMFLLYFVNPSLPYTATLFAVFSMYLLAAIVPTMALFDWVIKGSIAILLFRFIGFEAPDILLISLVMWLFNFAIPAIFGSYFVVTFQPNKQLLHE